MKYFEPQDKVRRLLLLDPVHSNRVSQRGVGKNTYARRVDAAERHMVTAALQPDLAARPAANHTHWYIHVTI